MSRVRPYLVVPAACAMALLAGCGGGGDDGGGSSNQGPVIISASTGGTVSLGKGVITIGPGALNADSRVTVEPASGVGGDPRLVPGTAYEFGTGGAGLSQPVTVTIGYSPASLRPGSDPSKLKIVRVENTTFVELPSTVNTAAATVSAETQTLGTFAIIDKTPADISGLIAQGRTQLNQLLVGTSPPNEQTITSLYNTWRNAYLQNASVKEAQFGYALSLVLYRAQLLVDAILEAQTGSSGGGGGRAATPEDALASVARSTIPWNNRTIVMANPGAVLRVALLAPYIGQRGASRASLTGAVDQIAIRNRINDLDAAIAEAIPLLEPLSQDAAFTFAIADPRPGAAAGSTVSLDQGEIQALLTALYVGGAVTRLANAYDWTFGAYTFSWNGTIESRFSSRVNAGTGTIAPSEYTPGGTWLSRASDGAARFATAKEYLNKAADAAVAAVTTLRARPTQSGHLLDAAVIPANLTTEIQRYKAALNGPFNFRVRMSSSDTDFVTPDPELNVTLNLNAWFTNPPASLVALMPTYRISRVTDPFTFTQVTAVRADYPDATLGGLLVNPPAGVFQVGLQTWESFSSLAGNALPVLRMTILGPAS